MKICLPLHRSKDVIFEKLKCFPIFIDQEPPGLPGPDPGPLGHLKSLASIARLAATLPATLPMRNDLQSLASKALDAVVADLGDDVKFDRESVATKGDYAK